MSAEETPKISVKGTVSISAEEVLRLVETWFEGVAHAAPAEVQQKCFAPGAGVSIWTGQAFSMVEHIELHKALEDEVHRALTLELSAMPGAPGRITVRGTVEWQATIKGKASEPRRIRAIADEDWDIERGPDGRPRFARYLTRAIRYLPGSAELSLPGR